MRGFFIGYCMTSENYFRDYLLLTEDKLMTKMDHYLDVYHRLLAPGDLKTSVFWKLAFGRVAPYGCGKIILVRQAG